MVDRPDPKTPLPEDSLLAGEYVLGLLEPEDRAYVDERLKGDLAFAGLVEGWENHFAAFGMALEDEAPPAALKDRLLAAIVEPETAQAPEAPAARDEDEGAEIIPAPVRPARRRPPSLVLWQAAAAGFAGLSVGLGTLLFLLLTRPPEPIAPQRFVASLSTPDTATQVLIEVDGQAGALRVKAFEIAEGDGVTELWLLPPGEAPRSLGVFDPEADRPIRLAPEDREVFTDETVLAISREPVGGSPTGLPTGPVIAIGPVARL